MLSFVQCKYTSYDGGSLSKLKISAIKVITNIDHELIHSLKRFFDKKRKPFDNQENERVKKTKTDDNENNN